MTTAQISSSLNRAIGKYQSTSSFRVLQAYVTRSDIWDNNFNIFIQTNHPERVPPLQDFREFHALILDELKEARPFVDRIIIVGERNAIPFENNMITNPNSGATYTTLWHR